MTHDLDAGMPNLVPGRVCVARGVDEMSPGQVQRRAVGQHLVAPGSGSWEITAVLSYLRDQLIAVARRRDKAEVMAIVKQTLSQDPAPGLGEDTIQAGLRELRGD